jgi:phage terminase small subunit
MSDGLTNKQRAFIEEYLRDFNATQAAIRCGYSQRTAYSIGQENLKKPEIAEVIKARLDEMTMQTDEILLGLTQQARSDIGVFFKVIEEWTYYPLPSHEVIDAKEVDILDEDGEPTGEKKTSYWVRHIAVDLDKVVDPRYSHLLAEFSDSPKDGISIKPYSKQTALQTLAKIRGLLVNKTELTGKDGGPVNVQMIEVIKSYDQG